MAAFELLIGDRTRTRAESERVVAEGRFSTYREFCTPSKAMQAQLLEKLRYRHYPMSSLQQRIMQRLGDFGRKYLPLTHPLGYR